MQQHNLVLVYRSRYNAERLGTCLDYRTIPFHGIIADDMKSVLIGNELVIVTKEKEGRRYLQGTIRNILRKDKEILGYEKSRKKLGSTDEPNTILEVDYLLDHTFSDVNGMFLEGEYDYLFENIHNRTFNFEDFLTQRGSSHIYLIQTKW